MVISKLYSFLTPFSAIPVKFNLLQVGSTVQMTLDNREGVRRWKDTLSKIAKK
jgi:hypothetical protein